jgi:dolichol-phosphate mannosyltransferase
LHQPVELSIVVPVYNEVESLAFLHGEIAEALATRPGRYEVLFVDDGSTDGSLAALLALKAADDRVRVLRLAANRGQSAALDAGFQAARGAVVATLDADLQNDPADLPVLLERLAGDPPVDVVCGVRRDRRDDRLRRWSSFIANGVRNRVTGDRVTDVGCSLRVMRRRFLLDLPAFNGMHRFLPTLLQQAGARVTEMPVRHRSRRFGEAKYNIRNRLGRALVDLFAVRWLQSRWIDRRAPEEVHDSQSVPVGDAPWISTTSGSGSGSPARPASPRASSSSGWPAKEEEKATSPTLSGSSASVGD